MPTKKICQTARQQGKTIAAKKAKGAAKGTIAFLFDTETTGLISNNSLPLDKQPEIIEFYGCLADLETGEIYEDFETFCKPSDPITEEITKITSITNEMVTKAPRFKSVADRIQELIEKAPVVIAHNLSFDVEMLDIEFKRMNRKLRWPRLVCTVEQTVHIKGFRLSLGALHEYLFSESFTGAHRAKADVHAMLRCCCELKKRDVI
jgi:DNA polymerase III epsilon subunit family exonuclease